MILLETLDGLHLGELGLQRHAWPIDDAKECSSRIRRGPVGECRQRNLQREKASREQAGSIDEVNVAVRQLDEMTQHNAALVEETNAAIEQTEAQANELDRVIGVFTLAGPDKAASAPERGARGVRGMNLAKGGKVIALLVAENESQSVLTATENGYGTRTPIAEYTRHGRGTQGMIAIQTSERNGKVVAATLVSPEDEIMLITSGGVLIRTRVNEICEMSRSTQGVTLINLGEGEKLSGLQCIFDRDDENGENGNGGNHEVETQGEESRSLGDGGADEDGGPGGAQDEPGPGPEGTTH